MARRSRIGVTPASKPEADAKNPPSPVPSPVISDASKLAFVALACLFGIYFGFRVSSNLSDRQTAQTDAVVKKRALAEHKLALESLDERERAMASASLSSNGTLLSLPKWNLVIEKVSCS